MPKITKGKAQFYKYIYVNNDTNAVIDNSGLFHNLSMAKSAAIEVSTYPTHKLVYLLAKYDHVWKVLNVYKDGKKITQKEAKRA